MNKAFTKLAIAVELLKIAIRTELLKLLGVEDMIESAFKEGWSMHSRTDHMLVRKHLGDQFHCIQGRSDLDKIIHSTRCWRSVDEAWVNSDAQEMFE